MQRKPESWLLAACLLLSGVAACASGNRVGSSDWPGPTAANDACPEPAVTLSEARAVVDRYCVNCHSASGAAGPDYDFRSDSALIAHRRNVEAKLKLRAMPPPGFKQPLAEERRTLQCWAGAPQSGNSTFGHATG